MTKKTSTPTKPPGKRAGKRVEDEDDDDGEGAQAVDVGPIAPIGLVHASARANASADSKRFAGMLSIAFRIASRAAVGHFGGRRRGFRLQHLPDQFGQRRAP